MKEALNNAKVVLAMKADGETMEKIEASSARAAATAPAIR